LKPVVRFAAYAALVALLQWLAVGPILGPIGHLYLYLANLFFVYVGLYSVRPSPKLDVNYYVLGYLVFFIIFFVLARQPLLLGLFIILYAAMYHIPGAVGYLFVFAFAYGLLAPFSLAVFALFALLYTGLRWLVARRTGTFAATWYVFGFLLFVATLMPLLYMCTLTSFQDITKTAGEGYVQEALKISLLSSTISTAVVLVLGVPLAYVMARYRFRGYAIVDTLIDLPILIPQPVVGIALLTLLGPKSLIGGLLAKHLGIEVAGTMWGIVAAQVFVSSPFLIRAAMTAFQGVDEKLEYVAQTLGASPFKAFFTVALPLASSGIFFGCVLSWARAISEYGALSVIAYRPASAPVLIYDVFTQYGLSEARPISVVLVIVCLWAFVCLRILRTWSPFGLLARARRKDLGRVASTQPLVG